MKQLNIRENLSEVVVYTSPNLQTARLRGAEKAAKEAGCHPTPLPDVMEPGQQAIGD